MAQRKTPRRKTTSPRRSNRFVCSRCGFKAAHAAGLGRHRSAAHGVVSKRQRALAARGTAKPRGNASGDAALTKRLAELERRYDRLLTGLEKVLRQARKR